MGTNPGQVSGLTAAMYLEARAWLLANDSDAPKLLEWAQRDLAPPQDPERLAYEIVRVILCAGRSAQAARTIERKVLAAISAGKPVVEVFGYRAKAAAIERAWRERAADFASLQQVLATGDVEALVDWCGELPFIGDDTKYQLAKNFGAVCPKPDSWLCRLAGMPDRPRLPAKVRYARCLAMISAVALATGDSIAVCDTLAWAACNKGVLKVTFEPYQVTFTPGRRHMGSIFGRDDGRDPNSGFPAEGLIVGGEWDGWRYAFRKVEDHRDSMQVFVLLECTPPDGALSRDLRLRPAVDYERLVEHPTTPGQPWIGWEHELALAVRHALESDASIGERPGTAPRRPSGEGAAA